MVDRKAELQRIVELFDDAEARIKRAEQLSSTITVPSVNELRYVGYHLTKALLAEDDADFDRQLGKATSHCQRAIYDANEIGILYLLENIQLFQRDYANSTEVVPVVPNYVGLLKASTEAQLLLEEARQGLKESRELYYTKTEPHFARLREIHLVLELARPEINKRIKRQTRKDRATAAMVLMTIALLLFAVASFFDIGIPSSATPAVATEPEGP